MIATKVIPIGFLFIGIFLLMQVFMPVVSFQLWELGQKYSNSVLVSPLGQDSQVLGISIQNKDNFSAFFSTLTRETQANYVKFNVSIPKLKIDNAQVSVDSNDLSQGLAHLPGSALPGEKGNMFISGHSALSNFFKGQSAIFSNLQDIKKGDEIVVEASGIKYKYQVAELRVVDPKDISVLNAPEKQGRYISLMTCVPPGLNFKRLVVLGKMI